MKKWGLWKDLIWVLGGFFLCFCLGEVRWGFQEKGQGSATDMVRRDWVKQISERDVGMFDILVSSSTTPQEMVFHMIWTCKWEKRVFGYIFWCVCVSGGASDYALVVVENTEEWDSLWSVICGFKRLDQIPKRERERNIYWESQIGWEKWSAVGTLIVVWMKNGVLYRDKNSRKSRVIRRNGQICVC